MKDNLYAFQLCNYKAASAKQLTYKGY